MELVILSLGVLVVLIVAAAVIDLKARRRRARVRIDPDQVGDTRRLNESRYSQYDHGQSREHGNVWPAPGP